MFLEKNLKFEKIFCRIPTYMAAWSDDFFLQTNVHIHLVNKLIGRYIDLLVHMI